MLPNPFVLFCVFGCRKWRWLAVTDFSPWDLRSSYPYFADDQPTVGIFFLISDMNQVLLSLLLDYVETNQPLRYLWNIIVIKVKLHGWRHCWLNRHDLCLFYIFSILNPRFTAITQMTLLVSALSFSKRIYIVTVVLSLRLSASVSLSSSSSDLYSRRLSNWCLCLGSTLFTALLLSRSQRIFSSMSAIISWCVPLIVFQLSGCFQEFLVGVEKVAFSHPQGSIIGFLSSPLFSHTCGHVFAIFLVLTGSLTCIGPILFVQSLIDSIVFEIDVRQVWMLAISGVYLSKWWKW